MLEPRSPQEQSVLIRAGGVALAGDLVIPQGVAAIVLFAHGSGSSRHSPRNRYVAGALHAAGLGTLLMDLLTEQEESFDVRSGHLRFNIDLLCERVVAASEWLAAQEAAAGLRIGCFGASTGAAAALCATAARPDLVRAVVSRGGRPDLAALALDRVTAPTLLIVGERDTVVLTLNQEALKKLRCTKELIVVPGATHLFEEAGALEEVSRLAAEWFGRHLTTSASP